MTHPIPDDFEQHAKTENDRELEERYGFGPKIIKRMRTKTGVASPAARIKTDLPDDFEHHRHLTNVALARRYGVGEKVIRRYRKAFDILNSST